MNGGWNAAMEGCEKGLGVSGVGEEEKMRQFEGLLVWCYGNGGYWKGFGRAK